MRIVYNNKYFDFIPLFGFFIAQVYLLYVLAGGEVALQWPHFTGFIVTILCCILFIFSHRGGALFTGCICVLGVLGLVSFTPAISVFYFDITIAKHPFRIIRFQPVFVIWFSLHLVISGKHYNGILSRAYWR
jgi:hypothetical protein